MSLELLLAQWDAVIQTPDDVAKLNALILQWAVQGKLVPQCAEDEPASILLNRIGKEKSIKTIENKKLPPIETADNPYQLPIGWSWARLGQIIEMEYGKGLPDKKRNDHGNVPVYGSNGIVGNHDESLIDSACVVVGRKGSSGEVNLAEQACWVIDTAFFVIPPKGLDLIYLYYLLKSLKLSELGKGIKPGLNRNEAYLLIVGIPPLKEQKRIAAKVDELFEQTRLLAEQMAQAQAQQRRVHQAVVHQLVHAAAPITPAWQIIARQFDTLYQHPDHIAALKQTILQLAVQGRLVPQDEKDEDAAALLERIAGEREALIKAGLITSENGFIEVQENEKLFSLPSSWKWVRLGQLVSVLNGYAFKSNSYVDISNNQVIRLGNVKNDLLLFEANPVFIPDNIAEENMRYLLGVGDILITMTGTRGKRDYGFTALIEEQHVSKRRLFLNQRVGCIRVIKPLHPSIINVFLKSEVVVEQLLSTETGTANQGNIGSNALKTVLFPLPPLAEQKRIVAKVDELFALSDQLTTHTHTTEAIRLRLRDALLAG